MLPLARRRDGLARPDVAAMNRLPCVKQIPQQRSPCASLYKNANGRFCSLSHHPETDPPLGVLGAVAVIPLLQKFLNISVVTPRSLSPASCELKKLARPSPCGNGPSAATARPRTCGSGPSQGVRRRPVPGRAAAARLRQRPVPGRAATARPRTSGDGPSQDVRQRPVCGDGPSQRVRRRPVPGRAAAARPRACGDGPSQGDPSQGVRQRSVPARAAAARPTSEKVWQRPV